MTLKIRYICHTVNIINDLQNHESEFQGHDILNVKYIKMQNI